MWWMLATAWATEANSASVAWCFGSGLRVLFEEDNSRPEVRIRTVVEGGSALDAKPGLAHLVEHLWFESSHDGVRVWDRRDSLGLRLNAHTERDVTTFETSGPRASTRAMIMDEVHRLEDPLREVTEAMFEVERNVVRNELRQNHASTARVGFDPLYARMFPQGHAYHHLPIGSEQTLESLTLEDVRDYAKQSYIPENTTLYVAGNLTTGQFEKLVVSSFHKALLVHPGSGAVTTSCDSRMVAEPVPEVKPGPMLTWSAPVESRSIVATWAVPAEDAVFADFASWITGWKLEEVTDRGAYCGHRAHRRAGVVVCVVPLKEGDDGDKLLSKGLSAASQLWQPNQREFVARTFASYRSNAMGDLYRSLERGGDLQAARHYHLTGNQNWLQSRVEDLSVKDFSEAARVGDSLRRKSAHVALVEPVGENHEALPKLHGTREGRVAAQSDASVDRLERIMSEPNWTSAETRILSNGLTVTALPFGTLDTVRVAMVLPGGAVREPEAFLDYMAWEALPDVEYQSIKDARAVLGDWFIHRRPERWTYRIDGVDLDKQLALLKKHLKKQVPGSSQRQKVRKWKAGDSDAHERAWAFREGRLRPGVPVTSAGILAHAQALSGKQTRAWTQQQLRSGGAHLLIVGGIQPLQAMALAKRHFGGSWGSTDRRADLPSSSVVKPDHTLHVDTSVKADQATVVLECRLDPANAAVAQLATALVGTRAEDLLRQRLGATYGVTSSTRQDALGWRLELYTEVSGAGEAVPALLEVLKIPPDEATLNRAKVDAARRWADRLSTSSALVEAFGARVGRGQSPVPTSLAQELGSVDLADVESALATCTGHEVVSVVGPAEGLTSR